MISFIGWYCIIGFIVSGFIVIVTHILDSCTGAPDASDNLFTSFIETWVVWPVVIIAVLMSFIGIKEGHK